MREQQKTQLEMTVYWIESTLNKTDAAPSTLYDDQSLFDKILLCNRCAQFGYRFFLSGVLVGTFRGLFVIIDIFWDNPRTALLIFRHLGHLA